MKKLIMVPLALVSLILVWSCSKEDHTDGENIFKASINGKDSVFTITKATLQSFSGFEQLSIITKLSGTSFDLYIHSPEIAANKEYPVANPFSSQYPEEFSSCYYRILQPNSVYTARAYVSTVIAPEYKTTITELSGNQVKGTIRFKAIDQGYLSSGELIIDASFSTNLLQYIDNK